MILQIKQAIRSPIQSLLANKVRSFLTILGIVIGVSAVVVIMAVGAGAQSLILGQIESLGSDLVGVLPGNSGDGAPASAMGIVVTTLTYDDLLAIKNKNNAPNIKEATAYVKGFSSVSWGSNSYDTNISGTTASYLDVEGGEVEFGRFFTEAEEKSTSKIVVLGSTVAKEVFGQSDPIGKKVKIKKRTFEVIGVMKERGTVAFQNYDDQVFIPIVTMQKTVEGIDHITMMRMKISHEDNTEIAIEEVKATLREEHGIKDTTGTEDDFTVRGAAQALDIITTITDSLKFFLAAMAAISLIVGGIGIMNIMLISVNERTREIGLRKAVGANNRHILIQFLLESIVLTILGGLFGLVAGTLFSFLVAVVANALGYDWTFHVSLFSIILSVTVSMLIGLIFGIVPAKKASQLEPIEALRYE
ncbi:multidrug ABC transporter substrate-binding protein [Candidatus Parcubacteria bacterium]|nr:MAG: multidrug ABC transporter substrate-binding protein [Candidatus Parcubacteria bacterium]